MITGCKITNEILNINNKRIFALSDKLYIVSYFFGKVARIGTLQKIEIFMQKICKKGLYLIYNFNV